MNDSKNYGQNDNKVADSITIPVSRYEDLLKKEFMLEIIKKIYQTSVSYSLADSLALILGPRKDDDNA